MNVTERLSRIGSAIFTILVLIAVLSTVAYGAVDTGTWSVISLAIGCVAVLWLIGSIRSGVFAVSMNLLQLPVLVLVLIGVIQLIPIESTRSLDPYNTRLFLIRLVCFAVFFAACLVFIDTKRRISVVAIGSIIFGSLMAFVGTLQRLASPDAIYGLREPDQAIPFGPFVNQHHFAAFMEMTGAMAVAFLLTRSLRNEKKLFIAIAAVLMALACVLTSSRGGLACFVVGISVVAFLSRTIGHNASGKESVSRKMLTFAALGFAAAVVAMVVFVGGDQSLLRGIGLDQVSGDVTNGRLHFWSVALKIFAADPFLGAGLDAFGVAFTKHDTWNGVFRVENAHNEYLQFLAEGGVVAFSAVIAFVIFFVTKAIKNIQGTSDDLLRTCAIGSFGGCVAIMLHSMVDFPLRTPSNAFIFLLLVTVATMTSKIRSAAS